MVDIVDELTPLVVTVKLVWVAPPPMVILGGTAAAAMLLLDSATSMPAGGAAPFKVTVAVEGLPPTTEVGLRVSDDRLAGVTVRGDVRLEPPYEADMFAADDDATPAVLI